MTMSDKDAAVAITKWIGEQQRAGVSQKTIDARIAADPVGVAEEIGIPVEALSIDVLASDGILDAMVEAAIEDAIEHDPDGGIAKHLGTNA